jgi:hypothetical protein
MEPELHEFTMFSKNVVLFTASLPVCALVTVKGSYITEIRVFEPELEFS